jgi:CheY-like chemotaxis protein
MVACSAPQAFCESARDAEPPRGKQRALWRPDLLVLDVAMPGMSGLDVCRVLRADAGIAHLPILIVSASAFAADLDAGRAACADEYLPAVSLDDLDWVALTAEHDVDPLSRWMESRPAGWKLGYPCVRSSALSRLRISCACGMSSPV